MSEENREGEDAGQGEPTWVGTDPGWTDGALGPADAFISDGASVTLLEQRLTEAHSNRREAERNVADRFREIAQLTRMLRACEDALAASGHEIGIHGEMVGGRVERSSGVTDEVLMLSHSVDSLQLDLRRAREECARQAYKLTALRGRLEGIEGSRSWKLTAVFRTIAEGIRRLVKGDRATKPDLEVIRGSSLFDGAWYVATNHDVKVSGLDPAEHYLLYGGFEGRKASPGFDGERYLSIHQDVRASGINPLLHYEMYGKAEGRPISSQPSQAGAPPANVDSHEVRDAIQQVSNDGAARAGARSMASQSTSNVDPPPSLR